MNIEQYHRAAKPSGEQVRQHILESLGGKHYSGGDLPIDASGVASHVRHTYPGATNEQVAEVLKDMASTGEITVRNNRRVLSTPDERKSEVERWNRKRTRLKT